MYIPSRTSTNHTLEALALASSSVPPPGTGTRLEPEQPPPCRSDNEDEDDDTTTPACFCPPLHGMSLDVQARLPLYPDDWRVPVCSSPRTLFKLLNATLFAFVVQLIPALIFAEVLEKQTHGAISVVETLLSSGIIGLLYAVFSGQPLVLVGITGYGTIVLPILYVRVCVGLLSLSLDFLFLLKYNTSYLYSPSFVSVFVFPSFLSFPFLSFPYTYMTTDVTYI